MRHKAELTSLLRIDGVRGVAWIDRDGCTLLEVGELPDLLGPNAIQLAQRWAAEVRHDAGSWREVHSDGWKMLIRTGQSGFLLLVTDEEANLGQIRLASRDRMVHLDELAAKPITGRFGGGER